MTREPLHILIADYVPLANKGEEAIVRGIADMLGGDRPVRIGVFDNVQQVKDVDGITIFPIKWIFRQAGKAASGPKHSLHSALICVQMRLGQYSTLRNLLSARTPEQKPLQDFWDKTEYVLVGHDGAFCVESCGVIHLARKAGKSSGILGMSGGIGGVGRIYKGWLYRRALNESDFCVFREETSQRSMQQVADAPDKLILAPDPAFAMRPAAADMAREILESYESYSKAKSSGTPVVAATVLEKGRVFNDFMPGSQPDAKRVAHAEYLAHIFDTLIRQHGVFLVFLPHSIEGDGSDVIAANHVVDRMRSSAQNYVIIDKDLSPRVLKSIIGECDFLVAQRTHSVIGAISVGTPFAALTNRKDTRTHGIVGKMCDCSRSIVNMEDNDAIEASRRVMSCFADRERKREHLNTVSGSLSAQLKVVTETITSITGQEG